MTLRSSGYSYGVRISHPEPAMRLDDNCFDLRDGETRLIRVTGIDPARLTVPHRTRMPA
ncbi:glycoside hydrolase family 2 protein [Amycolatopsis sulphurea]|uniref:glycoside hydrolase family 2 protein n=1 Tax=Amycolatopsis sulphurea TaxID=76022 RepID=UPI0031830FB5